MKKQNTSKKITSKQVVAWIGIILLVLLYIGTLLVAIFDKSASGNIFFPCIIGTIAIPSLIWVYTWLYGRMTGRHTFADLDLGQTGQNVPSSKDSEE